MKIEKIRAKSVPPPETGTNLDMALIKSAILREPPVVEHEH